MNAPTEQEKLTSQWITSLAISVVCCAALFLVFAGYIVDLHRKMSETAIRVELLQELQTQMIAELNAMRRPIPVMPTAPMNSTTPPATQAVPSLTPQQEPQVAPMMAPETAPVPPVDAAPAPKVEPVPLPAPAKAPAPMKDAPAKPPVAKH